MMRSGTVAIALAGLVWGATSLKAQGFPPRGFASSLAVGPGEVIAGEPGTQLRPGTVYVFRKNATSWIQAAKLNAPNPQIHDAFGLALALDKDHLYVSALPTGDGPHGGVIHSYRKDATGAWRHAGSFSVSGDTSALNGFGTAIAVSGDWALVGAPGVNSRTGAVYAFHRGTGDSWTSAGTLTAPHGTDRDAFGSSIAVANGWALIGAPARAEGQGAAYLFKLDSGAASWALQKTIEQEKGQRSDGFGTATAFRGNVAVIGAPVSGTGYGAVFFYRREQDTTWVEDSRLAAYDGRSTDRFGTSIALDGNEVWVGAPTQPQGSAMLYGMAYVFRMGKDSIYSSARRLRATKTDPRDRFGQTVAVSGNLAAVGATGQDYNAGVAIVYERGVNGEWRETSEFATAPDALAALTGNERKCSEAGKVDVFNCGGAELESFLPVKDITIHGRGVRLNDMWGWTDSSTGRDYAMVGRIDGTSFLDVTDPAHPRFLGDLPRTPGTPAGTWRDIKTYKDYAFIVADGSGAHGMQVFDLRQLRKLARTPVTFKPNTVYTMINSAHNIVINTESGFAYAVGSSAGGEICGGGLHMIDIHDPMKPTFVGCFSDPATGRRGTGYTHDAQCVNYTGPDTRYHGREICMGANETAISIADVTDKKAPKALSRITYDSVTYAHQGWFTKDQHYWFSDDESDEIQKHLDHTRTMIWDVADLEQPKLAGVYYGPNNASDHNLYIKGDTMYQSNYRSGLRIVDISDPLKPHEVGYFDTAPYLPDAPGFSGSWSNYPFFKNGMIGVTSGSEGFFLVKKREMKPVS